MSDLVHKRHNVSVLMYHIVCPVKYRRAVFTPEVEQVLEGRLSGNRATVRDKVSRNRYRPDHVHFLGAIGTKLQSDQDCASDKEHYGA